MKILLHMCCGPCSIYPISILQEENISFEGLYFNPNIHPLDEFNKRKENLDKLSKIKNFKVHYFDDFDQSHWHNYKNETTTRCQMCYKTRLEFTAKYTKENNFDGFTTTLFISPYQDHDYMFNLCNYYAKKYNLKFVYHDFRNGFREATVKSKELDIYCQKYCGCITSLVENPRALKFRRKMLKSK